MQQKTRRTLARLLVAVVLTAVSVVGFTGTASAYTKYGQFQQVATSRCLDSNAAGAVYTLPCQAGNGWQTWMVEGPFGNSPDGYERVVIHNIGSGRCLEVFQHITGPRISTDVCGTAPQNNSAMLLDARGSSWSNVQLRNLPSGLCVDGNVQGAAYALACNYTGNTFQAWRLI
jgi:hypothetical protein